MARITKRAVNALTAREREYMLWDHEIKGFGVRVHPSGRKVSLVKYRHQGRVVKKTIGPTTPFRRLQRGRASPRSSPPPRPAGIWRGATCENETRRRRPCTS